MNEIKHFMTVSSHAIGRDQTLKLAHERMQQLGARRLPVLEGGVLVGVVSDHDIALIGAISPAQAEETTVEDVMSVEPYAVTPDADVASVTAQMAEHKHDCAVVMDHNKVLGVFTTSDALQLLAALLRATHDSPASKKLLDELAHQAVGRKV
jgi:acetoin utilization protein AcuB